MITAAEALKIVQEITIVSELPTVYESIRRMSENGDRYTYSKKHLTPADIAELEGNGFKVTESIAGAYNKIEW